MPKPASESEFVPVSRDEGRTLLKESVRQFSSCVVWTKDQKVVVNTHLASANDIDDKLTVWVPKEHDLAALSAALAQAPENSYFSVSTSRANVLFRAKFLGVDGESLLFAFPQEMFKIQRRKSFRLPIPDGYVVKVDFRDPVLPAHRLSRRVFDISAGGLSFLTPLDEEPMFRQGTKLVAMTFKLKGRDLAVEAEIRHSREVKTAKVPTLKVGCEFTQIRPGDSQYIAAYVFEESRKYLSKLF